MSDDPIVAEKMNTIPKVVFSTTLDTVDWANTRLVRGDAAAEVAKLKHQPGKDLAIFGSANLTTSLLQAGLVDELRILVNPVVLGNGKPLFASLSDRVNLTLRDTRVFHSGNVLLYYRPEQCGGEPMTDRAPDRNHQSRPLRLPRLALEPAARPPRRRLGGA